MLAELAVLHHTRDTPRRHDTTTGPACLLPAYSPAYLPLVRNIAITPLPAPPPPPPSYLPSDYRSHTSPADRPICLPTHSTYDTRIIRVAAISAPA